MNDLLFNTVATDAENAIFGAFLGLVFFWALHKVKGLLGFARPKARKSDHDNIHISTDNFPDV